MGASFGGRPFFCCPSGAEGYKHVLRTLYDPTPRNYFDRCRRLLDRLGPNPHFVRTVVAREVRALLRSLRGTSETFGAPYGATSTASAPATWRRGSEPAAAWTSRAGNCNRSTVCAATP
jgi:hypothetical protein